MSTSISKIHYLLESSFDAFLIPSVLLSPRSMWPLKQLSGVAVSRRGFLQPVSIETHSSSWTLLPTYPLCHLTSLSSHPWPISASELRWNGHWVDPLGLLLSLQPLREIKPTWVCFLSVCPPIWLSAPTLSVSFFSMIGMSTGSHDAPPAAAFVVVFDATPFRANWVCCVCLRSEPATCWSRPNTSDEREMMIETDRACGLGSSQLSGSNLFHSVYSANERIIWFPSCRFLPPSCVCLLGYSFPLLSTSFCHAGLQRTVIIMIK